MFDTSSSLRNIGGTPAVSPIADGRHESDGSKVGAAERRAVAPSFWTEDKVKELKCLWAQGLSSTRIGAALGCSRNAAIGKVHRLGLADPPAKQVVVRDRTYSKQAPERKRERDKLWHRAYRERQKKKTLQEFRARGTSVYSAAYRKHLPRVSMTKSELRAMLSQAIQNTAALSCTP